MQTSVGRYHIFTSGIQYYKLRMAFGIPRYLIQQVNESLSSVNGKPQKSVNTVIHIICIAIDIIVNFSLFGLSKVLFLD